MDLLQQNAQGIKMYHIDLTKQCIQQWIQGFVDDTSIFSNLEYDNTNTSDLLQQVQSDTQIWTNFLRITGGELELPKCFYYILSWKWDKWGNPIPQNSTEQNLQHNSLQIQNTTDLTKLTQKDPSDSHKTLGTYKCLYGKEHQHIQYLLDKSNDFSNKILNSSLNHRQARLAYNTCYIPGMTYSLTPVHLTETTLNYIQQKAITQFIRKSGYEMTFPRDLVYRPMAFGGLGYHGLFSESNKNKLQTISNHIASESQDSKNILLNINLLQIHSSRTLPILESQERIEYTQENWLHGIQQFLQQTKQTLIIKNLWLPKINRINDHTIMQDDATHIPSLITWKCINNWRMYFQVTTITDIINFSGKRVLPQYLKKKYAKHYTTRTTHRWPKQNMPDLSTFPLWTNHIKKITKSNQHSIINKPLKTWKSNPNNIIQIDTMIHTNKSHIIIRDNENNWKQHLRDFELYETGHYNINTQNTLTTIMTNDYHPIDQIRRKQHFIVKYGDIYQYQIENIQQINPTNFQQFLEIQDWISPIITNLVLPYPIILNSKEEYELIICCDGGVKDNIAEFGITTSLNNNIVLETNTRLPEIHNDYTSNRAEAQGVYYSTHISMAIHKYLNNISNNPISINTTIYSDNKNVVDTVNQFRYKHIIPLKCFSNADFDILYSIIQLTRNIPISTLKTKHIKGHQDRNNNTNLSYPATLNIRADVLATIALKNDNVPIFPLLSNATLMIEGKQITASHNETIRKNFASIRTRKYLQDKHGWKDQTIEQIWWLTHEKAIQCRTSEQRIYIQNFIHNKLPTNQRQKLYYPYKSDICST
jgi:hypothetical protein